MRGRDHVESVAGIDWNQWPESMEYAGNSGNIIKQADDMISASGIPKDNVKIVRLFASKAYRDRLSDVFSALETESMEYELKNSPWIIDEYKFL